MGQIMMTVHTGPITLDTEFLVMDVSSPYTTIMGRRWLHRLKAVPFSLHQKLRFPTDFGIMEIKGNQVASKQCIMAAIKQNPLGAKQKGKIVAECSKGLQQLEGAKDACTKKYNETYEQGEELETVIFLFNPEKYFKIGQGLTPDDRAELVNFLTSNIDVFSWDPYEVPGVDPDYIQHWLNVDPHSKPIQQKSR